MTACAYCGGDESAPVVRRWSFFIDRQPSSLNERVFNGGSKRWKYVEERDGWIEEVWAVRLTKRIPKAKNKRRVIVVRHYKGNQKERDYLNLVGGCKSLIDALVSEELLIDDDPGNVEDHYKQLRSDRSGVDITIEELQ